MASGIFAVLDDIAALMDDVAVASKIATKKTAGILGDDLAVNAEKATGFLASRELPVLWKITKGSFLNKLIIIPVIFLLNVYLPIAVKIILILGGFYLAYEGVEKIIEFFFHKKHQLENHQSEVEILENSSSEVEEATKVKSAISTDFILSIEIVIIALATVLDKPLNIQIITVSVVAVAATIGVYGIVALIVRMDDAGYKLIKRSNSKGLINKVGVFLVNALPVIIKSLAVIGTIALLLVSGGIFSHNVEYIHNIWNQIPVMLKELILGILAGLVAFVFIQLIRIVIGMFKKRA
ncbi:DUF808 domain-containing protein [Polluticaenibacter yanchengensis]|uniref:DUF808 family protein n=1 Tax=Polluticaenibacter yanchengensis TaxID=3014562 RepID=A0ABT4UIH2_9BACT|nr:DUF808 family protein [Chitinophagaceae bacterium LY-5]